MKEVRFPDRAQAVIHIYIILILATIQEYSLKSELAYNICCIALPGENDGCVKFVMLYPFS